MPNYVAGVGVGGNAAGSGGNGLVVITSCVQICPAGTGALVSRHSYTAALQTSTVPPNTVALFAQLWGGGGAGGRYSFGGSSAYVSGFVSPVPPGGSVLQVAVGGGGVYYGTDAPYGGQPYAHPSNYLCTGSGAGAAAISYVNASSPLAVAGAGGGGGEVVNCNGGSALFSGTVGPVLSGNGLAVSGATSAICPGLTWGGFGASATAPGARGCGSGTFGAAGTGPMTLPLNFATGGPPISECGGSGGGGYFGGGSGGWHTGGGSGASLINAPGFAFVAGQSGVGRVPGGTNVVNYVHPAGWGGLPASGSGGDALVVLTACVPEAQVAVCPTVSTAAVETVFSYTGALATYTVPPNAGSVFAQLLGAGGSGGRNSWGGSGAYLAGYLSPLPPAGSVLNVIVGGGGVYMGSAAPYAGTSYSHPANYGCCGTGAGAAAVGFTGVPLAVAGAGGGGGESLNANGGSASWNGSSSGNGLAVIGETNPACPGQTYGGRGASALAPGARGCGSTAGTWGSAGSGPMLIPGTLSTGGISNQECGGPGGGGAFGACCVAFFSGGCSGGGCGIPFVRAHFQILCTSHHPPLLKQAEAAVGGMGGAAPARVE